VGVAIDESGCDRGRIAYRDDRVALDGDARSPGLRGVASPDAAENNFIGRRMFAAGGRATTPPRR